jgi:hypothetical protein
MTRDKSILITALIMASSLSSSQKADALLRWIRSTTRGMGKQKGRSRIAELEGK